MSNFVQLNNGQKMPVLGLGTWLSQPNEIKTAVEKALDLGYMNFDCAWIYENEAEIGEAIENKIKEHKVKREELFITSKLWSSFHRPEMVEKGFEETLKNLRLDYLDLYLIHWPVSLKPGIKVPSESDIREAIEHVDLLATWRGMENLVDSGRVRSIGVSNFNIPQLQNIIDHCRIKPSMNQIEIHVHFTNKKLVEFCFKNDIGVTAYSPLGAPGSPFAVVGEKGPLDDPTVLEIAKKYNATAGQILISYIIHQGIVCIPKSVSPVRLEENLKAANIKLSDEDFGKLNNLNKNKRTCEPKFFQAHKNYPFYED